MPIPTLENYLPTIGFESRMDQETGNTGWLDNSTGDWSPVHDTENLQNIYNNAFQQDASGKYIYGNKGYAAGRPGNPDLGGQVYAGGDYNTLMSNPKYAEVLNQFGITPDDFSYSDDYGYLGSPKFGEAQGALKIAGQKDNFLSNMSRNSGAMFALGSSLFAAPLAASMGALGAGATAGAGAEGALTGGAGATGGGFSLPGWEAAGQSGMLQSLPGMTAAPGAMSGVDAAMAGFSGAGAAGAGGAAFSDSFLPTDPFNPGADPLQGFPSEAAGEANIGTNTWNLNPEMAGGVPAAGTGVPGTWLDTIKGMIKGYNPQQGLARSLAQQAFKLMGGGEGAAGKGGMAGDILSIGSGIYGLTQAQRLRKLAESNSAKADPFGPYRGQFAEQLSALGRDPSMITQMPGYQAGQQAVERRMASQGYNGSGNMMTAMSKYGGDFYQQEMARLAGLSGANLNPANAAQISQSGNTGAIDLAGKSLASIGYGFGRNQSNDLLMRLLAGG